VKPLVPRAPSVARAHGPSAYPDPRLKAFSEHVAQRQRRWQSIPDMLSRPGVDWSPHADRRINWRRPTTKLQHSHKASIDAASSGAQTNDEDGLYPDTIRVAFIRIDFKADRGGDASTGNGRFDLSKPGDAAPPIDRAPHNRDFFDAHLKALSRYYDAQSYGRSVVVGEVWPRNQDGAYSCSDMADFGPWAFSQDIYGAAVDVFRAMLFAADTQSVQMGDRIPWQNIDRIVLIHAGGDLQSDVRQDSPEDIPSFTIGVSDTDGVIFRDSLQWNRDRPIEHASIVPETITQDGFYGAINGVLAHECGHLMFGFVDLYDVETGLPRVGLWSLMDSGNLAGSIVVLPDNTELFATGMLPPSIDPWQRGFTTDSLTFAEVDYGDTLRLRSGERHPDMRSVRLSSDE
jgi:M6 family metalloprotease-like protein